MAWKQKVGFNVNNGGTTKYLCLVNVRKGYGIGAKHAYAYLDWVNNLGKHADRSFPAGLAVPVYYNWTGTLKDNGKMVTRNWGHIAVRLPDGRVWTDGKYYANVDEVSSKYLSGSSYLGWGESVNDVRVIEWVNDSIVNKGNEDMIKDGDQDILRIIASEVKGWDFTSTHNGSKDATELAAWRGRDFRQLIREGWVEGQWYRTLKAKQAGLQTVVDTLNKELGSRPTKAQLEEALAKIQKETDKAIKAEEERLKAMALAEEQSKKYLESLNTKSEDTKLIDSIKEIIAKVVARFK